MNNFCSFNNISILNIKFKKKIQRSIFYKIFYEILTKKQTCLIVITGYQNNFPCEGYYGIS